MRARIASDLLPTLWQQLNDGRQRYTLILWAVQPETEEETDKANRFTAVERVESDELREVRNRRLLGDLFTTARANALKINEQIDSALSALGDDE